MKLGHMIGLDSTWLRKFSCINDEGSEGCESTI